MEQTVLNTIYNNSNINVNSEVFVAKSKKK